MSPKATRQAQAVDDTVRELLLLMPRLVGRAKRLPLPPALAGSDLAPRHLSLLAVLMLEGPMTVGVLAARLEVAVTTASLMVGELSERGVLDRREDPGDRRRRIVALDARHRDDIEAWLAPGARAWREVLAPLSPRDRALVVRTLRGYEEATARRRT